MPFPRLSPDSSPVLTFLGGAGTVTGSRYLVDTTTARVLVDCGMYQGEKELRERNWAQLPIDPATIDAVVLTHAHLDHSGYLPAIVADGFSGPVYCTVGTAQLIPIVLYDSARLQEEDAEYAMKKGYTRHATARPLFVTADVENALRDVHGIPYEHTVTVAPEVTATFHRAGHILGSSSVTLTINGGRRLLFSGDLGRPHHPLLAPPSPPAEADIILVESTYGDRDHDDSSLDVFADAITRTASRGGSVVIPAFAVDRTEVLLHHLQLLMRDGRVPKIPVYVDSPMALTTLSVYRAALADRSEEFLPGLGDQGDPFDPGDLHELRSVEQSKSINSPRWPCVIVSASGMATGGRVLHHLEHLLPHSRNTVILAGYQASGTRGESLQRGARQIKIHGRYVPVHAEVVDIGAFSVHADAGELVSWLSAAPHAPDVCYVIHGEPDASDALRDRIAGSLHWNAVVPHHMERVRLD